MNKLIHAVLLAVIGAGVFALTVTALPVLTGHHLGGLMLLAHMVASGTLVFALPAYAVLNVWRYLDKSATTNTQQVGFWGGILTGLITIATVFACMLPIASTDVMHQLIRWHGIAGFAMVPPVALLLWGSIRK